MRLVVLGLSSLGLSLLAPGCVSEESLRADLQRHVDASNACEVDEDCGVIYPGCPLGCFVAVRADAMRSCDDYADDLVGMYEATGRACDYDCPAHGDPFCDEDGRCAIEPTP